MKDDESLLMILSFPSSTDLVPIHRKFAEERLHITATQGGKPIVKATGAEIKAEICRWNETYVVDPFNIDTVDIRVIEQQLAIRMPSAAVREEFASSVIPQTIARPVPPRELLRYVMDAGQTLEAARRIKGHPRVIDHVEACIPCILHAEIRIGEKLIVLMVSHEIIGRRMEGNLKEPMRRKLQNCLSTILSSLPADDNEGNRFCRSSATLPGLSDAHLKFNLSCVRLRRVFLRHSEMLDVLFGTGAATVDADRRLQWEILLEAYVAIFDRLRDFKSMPADEINALQLQMDSFCRLYTTMFGSTHVTNYVHNLQAGHIADFLHRYGSVYVHANIGMEATMGTYSSFVNHGTQGGGHAGGTGGRFSEVQAVSRYTTSRAICAIGLMSGDQDAYVGDMEQEGHDALRGALIDIA